MPQETNPQFQKSRKPGPGLLPWIVVGVVAVILLGAAIIASFQRKRTPRPVGGEHRQQRVNLIIQSNVGGAEVHLNGLQKAITSDTHHKATLFNLAPNTYQITLKKQGYANRTETVEVTGYSISQTVRIDMEPNGTGK